MIRRGLLLAAWLLWGAGSTTFQAIAGAGPQGPITGMYFHSQPGDWIGQGQQRSFDAVTGYTVTPNPSTGASFSIQGNGEFWSLDFAAPGGAPLAVGSYENAVRYPFANGASPGINLSGAGRGCNKITGRFDVIEVVYGAGGVVQSFAADFVQHCEGGETALFGQIRYGVNTPINTAPVLPAPFTFTPVIDVPPGVQVTSNTVTISGITTAPISVQGGEYSVSGGAFTSAPGTIAGGQTVTLRLTSSSVAGTPTFATLKIGAASGTFQATTALAGIGTDVLYFKSDPGDYSGLGQSRFMHAGTNFVLAPSRNVSNGVSFSINGGGQTWSLNFAAGNSPSSPALVPGAYEGAARFPLNGANQPGLSFYGDGRACNTVAGRFDILDATYGAGGVVNSFAANFEHHCENSQPALRGRIRYNTLVPLFGTRRHDLGGDGRSDVLWHNTLTGENYLFPLNGTAILASEGFLRSVPDPSWQIVGTGDFDGDSKADILWRNSNTGENYVFLMDGRTIKPTEGFIRPVPDQDWQVAGIGDFDRDGWDDILWRNSPTGEIYIFFMDGKRIRSEGHLGTVTDPNWQIVGVADFDGDGRADLLLRHSITGQNYLSPLDGLSIKPTEGFIRPVVNQNWKVAGVGDFDGDGKADILWRNSVTGGNYLYPMDGTVIKPSEGAVRTVLDLNWKIAATGDYDGDWKTDILWRHAVTGQNYIYPMDGTSIKPTEGFTRTVGPGAWDVVGK